MLGPAEKMVQVFYMDEKQAWQPYTEALLLLQPRLDEGINLLLTPTQPLPADKLTVLPLVQIQRVRDRSICIGVEMVSQAEQIEGGVVAVKLEEWSRVLGISFRSQDYCAAILEQLELQIAASNQLPCRPEELIRYIAKEINSVDMAFENPAIAHHFFQRVMTGGLESEEERDAFRVVKTALMQGRKETMVVLLKEQHFPGVLQSLSFNFEFGDRRIDYQGEFQRISCARNILQLQDEQVIAQYRFIMKIRFLIDCPTAMFIEPNTQVVLNDLIRESTIPIIRILIQHPSFLQKYKELALSDPVLFIELFSELWEMFKLVSEDWSTSELKKKFHALFLQENLLEITFECVLKAARENRAELRLYQKFLESLNPFLSFQWGESQECLLSFFRSKQIHLLQVLLAIMALQDYNTKTVVLLFARYLIEASENRRSMRQAFISYVFGQFVAKIDSFFTTAEELQVYLGFLLRCYRVDWHRTRRCIGEGGIINRLEQQCENKYILILIIRFLRSLLESKSEELFIYLERHRCFSFLREAYFRTKKYSPRGVLYSMFLGLIKDLERSDNKCGVRYVFDILCPDNTP